MSTQPHPDYTALERKLDRRNTNPVSLHVHLFRMVNPKQFRDADILNGVGGYKCSGRWNLKEQFHCTYMSRSPETALEEVLAPSRRKNLSDANSLPRVLVCISVKLNVLLDLTDGNLRKKLRVSRKRMIEERWWSRNFNQQEAITQAVGRAAFAQHYEGMIVPSAADPHGSNVIVYPENLIASSELRVITPVTWK